MNVEFKLPEDYLLEIKSIKDEIKKLKQEFQPKEPNVYLTRNEVAELLSIDLSTLHNWKKKGVLKPMGIGSRVYYKREDVENAFIELKS